MRIGALNKRIVIQAQTKTSDGMGAFTVTWADITSRIGAAIWPVSAKETIKSEQLMTIITHRIRIRYRNAMETSYRIKFENRYFTIVSIIDPEMRHKWLDLMCKETSV
jgi:SPP1 family predicted phage head-tail adaptor